MRFSEPTATFVLRTGGKDLDGYVFDDEAHAREWMAQPLIRSSKYRAAPVWAQSHQHRCSHCDQVHECDRLTPREAEAIVATGGPR